MGRIDNKKHEELLIEVRNELINDGYRVIRLYGRSPDAIAIKDNKIIAVEVLGITYRHNEYKKGWTYTQKRKDYDMFDEVLIKTFVRNNGLICFSKEKSC